MKCSPGYELSWYVIKSSEKPFGLHRIWSRDKPGPIKIFNCCLFLKYYIILQYYVILFKIVSYNTILYHIIKYNNIGIILYNNKLIFQTRLIEVLRTIVLASLIMKRSFSVFEASRMYQIQSYMIHISLSGQLFSRYQTYIRLLKKSTRAPL